METTAPINHGEGRAETSAGDAITKVAPNASVADDWNASLRTDSPSGHGEKALDHGDVDEDGDDESDVQGEEDSDNDSGNDTWADDHLCREALQHIATYFMPGNHGKCMKTAPLSSGGYHHIELLEFEDGWSCIGRFGYDRNQPLGMDEAEIATMQYVAQHTSIPVPEIYYVNHNHNHVVGAAFVLMEHLPGTSLWELWDELSISHKKAALSQVAGVAVQLASLKFDRIGSLTTSGDIGPLFQHGSSARNGPCDTLAEMFCGLTYASSASQCCNECHDCCRDAAREVYPFFSSQRPVLDLCRSPFSLQHADFTAGNMLFVQDNPEVAPVFSGLIDFDGSGTGPVYYQYSHSGLLTTDDWREPGSHASNKELRKHYVRALANHFPPGSKERQDVHLCFRLKSYFLDQFVRVFPECSEDHDEQQAQIRAFLKDIQNGTGVPRSNVLKWTPDSDSELDD